MLLDKDVSNFIQSVIQAVHFQTNNVGVNENFLQQNMSAFPITFLLAILEGNVCLIFYDVSYNGYGRQLKLSSVSARWLITYSTYTEMYICCISKLTLECIFHQAVMTDPRSHFSSAVPRPLGFSVTSEYTSFQNIKKR